MEKEGVDKWTKRDVDKLFATEKGNTIFLSRIAEQHGVALGSYLVLDREEEVGAC